MPSQIKDYKNKKFAISELAIALKKTIGSFNGDQNPETFKIIYNFKVDGVEDTKKLTFDTLEMITSLEENSDIILIFADDFPNHYSIGLRLTTSFYSESKVISINLTTPTVEELKQSFSILETELNLEEISKQRNKDNKKISSNPKKDQNEEPKSVAKTTKVSDPENRIKQIKKEYVKTFGRIRIYKEDLVSIIKLFKNSYNYVEIQIDDFKIQDESDIDDVKSGINKDSTQYLWIDGSDNEYGSNLILRLNKYSASITAKDDKDFKATGVLKEIDIILTQRENRILKFIDSTWGLIISFIIVIAIMIIAIIILNSIYTNKSFAINKSFTLLLFAPTLFLIMYLVLTRNHYSIIYLFNSNEKQHFLTKYREVIIVLVTFILAIVGAIVGELIFKLYF